MLVLSQPLEYMFLCLLYLYFSLDLNQYENSFIKNIIHDLYVPFEIYCDLSVGESVAGY